MLPNCILLVEESIGCFVTVQRSIRAKGVFGSRHEVECNVTVPHLPSILVFGLEIEWNGVVFLKKEYSSKIRNRLILLRVQSFRIISGRISDRKPQIPFRIGFLDIRQIRL